MVGSNCFNPTDDPSQYNATISVAPVLKEGKEGVDFVKNPILDEIIEPKKDNTMLIYIAILAAAAAYYFYFRKK
jgi:hypothetical protein